MNAANPPPAFTLQDVPDYPARLEVECPHQRSRGLALVKWWLLAIPHFLIIAVSWTRAGRSGACINDGEPPRSVG